MSGFDTEEMLREIQAGAARGKLVASLRPTWPQLGEQLWNAHDAAQRVFFPGESRQSIVAEASNFARYSAKSPCAEDALELKDSKSNPKNELVLRLSRMYIGGLVNQLGGLSAVISAEVSARPAVALGRVVLDASTHCSFLLEDNTSVKERSLRAANLQLGMLRAEIADIVEGAGGKSDEAVEPLRVEVANLISAGLSDGFERATSKKGQAQNSFRPGTPAIEQLFKLVDGSRDESGLFRDAWRHASSVVHVQERRIIEFYFGSGEFSQAVHARSYAALQLMPAVLVSKEAFERAANYLGVDAHQITLAMDQALQWWSAASGMFDEQLLLNHTV